MVHRELSESEPIREIKSKIFRKVLDGICLNGGTMQGAEVGFLEDLPDCFRESFGDLAESNLQRFQNAVLEAFL